VKFQMAPNSLFAILLRSPWWISMVIAVAIGAVMSALLPEGWRVAGAVSGFPFLVIGVMALVKQWNRPSAAQVERAQAALSTMAWAQFAELLEQAFVRDGYTVRRHQHAAYDFELERQGRRMLVSAKRWKSARTGLESLRALQAAREAAEAADALHIGLGELSENAVPFAAQQRIALWQAAELAQGLKDLLPAGR
jgi:restriction system protein